MWMKYKMWNEFKMCCDNLDIFEIIIIGLHTEEIESVYFHFSSCALTSFVRLHLNFSTTLLFYLLLTSCTMSPTTNTCSQ